ncbi:ATP-binding protein [Azoarcus taiwanensis]|uniref:histidine kinase n=1 Tax=Azoarcus taiwanensis TaxID=666964 RepID=A0A972FD88_9RHOO|nr:ATP-binding protein [Azoarcus taiwanensis]NMG03167.1 sensor histidine kinase [Azoarcus taiwanensis]
MMDQIRRLVWLRWCSVALMALCTLLVPGWLDVTLPVGSLLAVTLVMAAFNAFTLAVLAYGPKRETSWLFVQLLADLLGWAAFVYFSGGATNPLISLLLPLIAIGAAVLPARLAWLLAACAVGCYSLLWNFYTPVRLRDPDVAAYWHLAGMWVTFALSALVMVGVVLRMTAALRARDRALAEAVQMRARDQALVSLGSLAAGAAHSLGTPLATMRLLVDELGASRTLPEAAREDIALIGEQIEHCRKTLGVLTARAGQRRAEGEAMVGVEAWVQHVLAGWQSQRPHAQSTLHVDEAVRGLSLLGDATLAQALETLLNNAADASPETVEVLLTRDPKQIRVEVMDRGPGMPREKLRELGQRPLEDDGKGLGIGLFLARSALERAGGKLEFDERPGGGTVARMLLPVPALQAEETGVRDE